MPADDEYTYGYPPVGSGYFPEARQQLSLYLQKYPQHARVGYGRNLLGRSFLDDGQPRERATGTSSRTTRSDKQGARAPDSLLYLRGIDDRDRRHQPRCIALAEFEGDVLRRSPPGGCRNSMTAPRARSAAPGRR